MCIRDSIYATELRADWLAPRVGLGSPRSDGIKGRAEARCLLVVMILVTFRESLLLVTGAVDIRYLVLVTLIVTRSLKLLTHSAESQALHGSSQSL